MTALTADRDQLRRFYAALFRHADDDTWLSLRAFRDDDQKKDKPYRISPWRLNGDVAAVLEEIGREADACAAASFPVVFAPPIATMQSARRARMADLANGLALSVECDRQPDAARRKLEALLGLATLVVESGGQWQDSQTGKAEPRLHLHWRLAEPTRTPERHAKLRHARDIATELVGADATNKPVIHCIRWAGSVHRKGEPKLCRIIAEHDTEIDLDEALEALDPTGARRRQSERGDIGGEDNFELPPVLPPRLEDERLAELKRTYARLFDLARFDEHHSRRDLALAGLACRLGWPPLEACRLIIAVRLEDDRPKDRQKADDRQYLRRTLALAYRDAGQQPADDHSEAEDEKKAKRSIATELVQIALATTELFTTPGDQIAYAAFEIEDHREVWPLRSRGFKTWLGRRLYEETKGRKTASAQAITDALVTIEGAAMFDGAVREVYLRVAHHNGRYYLDLADERWRVVEIAPTGWRVIAHPPVYFRRTRGTLPLPEPLRGGSLDPLRDLLNVATEDDLKILIAWTLAALRPAGPYPVLDLAGEQGTAKSTTARALRELIDPGEPMIRAAPKQERDLAIAVSAAHVLALDNISDVQPWLSDALCRFATGGGWACRLLYSDDDQILIDAMKPIMINGIEELALRPDLKDRTVAVVLPTIEEEHRIEEGVFWQRFEAARPAILGALLDVMAAGLANLPNVKLSRLPRMADFARWIAACEPALGWEPGSFAELYSANRTALGELAIEANETVRLIRDNAICHDAHESVGSLLDKLRALCGEDRAKLKELPKTPRALGGLLRRYAPELRTAGFDVIFGRRTSTGWPVSIRERVRAQPSQPSHRHDSAGNPQEASGAAYDGSHDGSDAPAQPSSQPSCSKASESATHDGYDGYDGSAGTQSRDNDLTLDDLDRMASDDDGWAEFDEWLGP